MKQFGFLLALITLATPLIADQQPTRPSIEGIADVLISGNNVQELLRFYGGILGLPAAPNLGCPSEQCMVLSDRQRIELNTGGTPPRNSLLELVAFETANVDQLRGYLSAHGISVTSIPPVVQGEKWIQVDAPEGHRVAFVERPKLTGFRPAEGQASVRLIHAGIVVRDRAAEDKFYKDILGFHVYWHGGMKEGEDNWADMQVPDGTDWIEYMLKVPENATHKQLGVMNHIALGVPDIHAAREQLIKNGWKGAEEPKIGRDGKWQLNLYDPNETRVELMEFKPTQEPCCSAYTGPHPGPK
jgi:catechol 2,3-dioxygenase-like lactoylglutathione lyase family enzyme